MALASPALMPSSSPRMDADSRMWSGSGGTGGAETKTGEGTTVHEELLQSLRETGLTELAAEARLLKDDEIVNGQHARVQQQAAAAPLPNTPSSQAAASALRRLRKQHHDPDDDDYDDAPRRRTSRGGGGASAASTSAAASAAAASAATAAAAAAAAAAAGAGKGLRQFSRQVCDRVQIRGRTTYNEVADDLVREYLATGQLSEDSGEQKNIRRRVYDALNVLMAMKIITKEKKEIRWLGLNRDGDDELAVSRVTIREAEMRIAQKEKELEDLRAQESILKLLAERNAASDAPVDSRIYMPFIVINTSESTAIDCLMTEDRTEIFFDFDQPFEVQDDSEILHRLLMGDTPASENTAPVASAPVLASTASTGGLGTAEPVIEVDVDPVLDDDRSLLS